MKYVTFLMLFYFSVLAFAKKQELIKREPASRPKCSKAASELVKGIVKTATGTEDDILIHPSVKFIAVLGFSQMDQHVALDYWPNSSLKGTQVYVVAAANRTKKIMNFYSIVLKENCSVLDSNNPISSLVSVPFDPVE